MVNLKRLSRPILWGLAISLCVGLVSTAAASEKGMAAANQVDVDSYDDFMDKWLFTHDGDNRGPTGPEHDKARDNIWDLFDSFDLPVVFEEFQYGGGTYENVVATQLGTKYPERIYIIGGHYDSANNPGADDNASGVALVLEAARILSQYDSDCTIRYIGFDMEERGLICSKDYVNRHANDDIRCMISTDMVAWNSGADRARIYGRTESDPLKNALAAATQEYGDGLGYEIRGRMDGSDHAPFEARGFKACLLIEWSGNPHYHRQSDSYDTPNYLDFDYAVKMARSVVGWLVDTAGVDVILVLLGDLNCDGKVNFGDINPFILALTDPAAYEKQYPGCPFENRDINKDGKFNFADINPFIALLSGEWDGDRTDDEQLTGTGYEGYTHVQEVDTPDEDPWMVDPGETPDPYWRDHGPGGERLME